MVKVAYHPDFYIPLPEKHRFPMEKYELLPFQLLHEGILEEENFFYSKPLPEKYILNVHDKTYYKNLITANLDRKAIRKIGFPVDRRFVERELAIVGGTTKSAVYALENGIGMTLSGGTHHAYAGHGEGFCILNDQAVAARYLQQNKLAKQILIVDLDVHQGNGTAKIFEGDDSVFTFSLHGEKNYPFKKEQSDLDVGLPDHTEDETYLYTLKKVLPSLIEKVKPDFIFYLCGVDILATDKLGRLHCTIDGCKKRDEFVLETCANLEIPVQCSLGGGYSKEIKHIVQAHANTFKVAIDIYE